MRSRLSKQRSTHMGNGPRGYVVLVVEDEALIWLALERALLSRGLEYRYATTLDQARRIVAGEQLAAAILDVRIRDELIFPIVDQLRALDVRCIFATG